MDSQGLELTVIAVLLPLAIVTICLVYRAWWHRTERASKVLRGGRMILPTPRRLLPDCFLSISGHTLLFDKDNVRLSGLQFQILITRVMGR